MDHTVRRVVMGEPQPKTSTFTHVEEVEPQGGTWLIWGADEIPDLPHHGAEPYVPRSVFPPAGGFRVFAMRVGAAEDNPMTALPSTFWEAEPAGLHLDPDRPGMHRTDTIDIGIVVSGEVKAEADDGETVVLRAGDVYVQNGALHNWQIDPDNPAHIVFVCLGATRTHDG
jgi:uncharacterized cupin superfamily protein